MGLIKRFSGLSLAMKDGSPRPVDHGDLDTDISYSPAALKEFGRILRLCRRFMHLLITIRGNFQHLFHKGPYNLQPPFSQPHYHFKNPAQINPLKASTATHHPRE